MTQLEEEKSRFEKPVLEFILERASPLKRLESKRPYIQYCQRHRTGPVCQEPGDFPNEKHVRQEVRTGGWSWWLTLFLLHRRLVGPY